MTSLRRVVESPVTQGIDESRPYEIVFTKWGTPSSPSCKLYSVTAGFVDVSATCLSGVASVVGSVVTTQVVANLTAGVLYRMVIAVTIGGSAVSAYLEILGEV